MSMLDNEDDTPENKDNISPPIKLMSTFPKFCTTIIESDALGVARMPDNFTNSPDNKNVRSAK